MMHKMEFGQAYYQDLAKRIIRKLIFFIFYFLNFILFSMYFRN
jgi:hypothetical protein